jgi:hypothetical protein
MIRRPDAGGFLLHTQADHAILAGFLAAHVGNEAFARLSAEVVAAVAAHDAGWPLHDDDPAVNGAGLPLHVFEIPAGLATKIWSASAERAAKLGAYGALLVSLHQLALSDFAMKSDRLLPRDVFEFNKFQHRQIERQEELRRELGLRTDVALHLGLAAAGVAAEEDQLRFDFRMLTLCDRLSLELCCGKALFAGVEDVYPRPAAAPVRIELSMKDGREVVVKPWPFDGDELVAEVPFRRVSGEPFAGAEEFRAAYRAAPVELMRYSLARP